MRNLVEKLLDQHCKNTHCILDRSIPKEITKFEASVGIVRSAWETSFKAKASRFRFEVGDRVFVIGGPLKGVITHRRYATVSEEKPDAKQRIEIQYPNMSAHMEVGE